MISIIHKTVQSNILRKSLLNSYAVNRAFCKNIENSNVEEKSEEDKKISGFAKAFEKFSKPHIEEEISKEPDLPFATLFKNSKFVELGDPEGKIVVGKIFHVVEDDLYIDFGWKFHCVCTRPAKNGQAYVRGTRVKLRIKDLELSSRFLGSAKDLTLLEADCHILGILSSPAIPKTKTPTL
ncbi:hypothetical protein PVAND_007607 [Polypedilum vanderplanki]|uniref:Mitochondrial ribosomal protein S28 n=1 Tax=Polypedilum vanderplanki TaxID=319348 RepID=A0A9J6C771_POLVA|nr:hypothetical protein PVAND_007607 [Polypedilum vanderplanki]